MKHPVSSLVIRVLRMPTTFTSVSHDCMILAVAKSISMRALLSGFGLRSVPGPAAICVGSDMASTSRER